MASTAEGVFSVHGDPAAFRIECRAGRYNDHTAGQAPGFEQANIVIMPEAMAADFGRYCASNPAACPLLAVGRPGDPSLPVLGVDIDIRSDLPRYRLYRHGRPAGDVSEISELWRDDFVCFAIGCSLSFEAALLSAGVRLGFRDGAAICAAYRTNCPTTPAGPFAADLVVTFRAIKRDQIGLAEEVTRAFPLSHGGPVHVGEPADLGIASMHDNLEGIGDVRLAPDEVAVFWACGVTALDAVVNAAPDFAISHAPAHMLITDRLAAKIPESDTYG